MNQQNEAQQGQMEQQPERNAHKAFSRRKFLLQASAVSVPVVLSLKSGKAWGCVELNCTPGETSLSNSGSAVASATSEKNPNAYERPQWSSMSQIISAFNVDFDDWLLSTFKAVLCTYETKRQSGRTYYRYTQLTCDMYSFNTWWNQVKKGSSAFNRHKQANFKTRQQQAVGYFKLLLLITKTILGCLLTATVCWSKVILMRQNYAQA